MHGSVDFLISCRAVICVRVCLLRSCCTAVKINYFFVAIGIASHSELVLTRCCVRGLFRNGQGAAELAFGSDTASLFLLILSSPLLLTPQIVRTQFRMAWNCFGDGKVLICSRVWFCHTRLDRVSNIVMEDVRLFLSVFDSGYLLDCSFAKTPGAVNWLCGYLWGQIDAPGVFIRWRAEMLI